MSDTRSPAPRPSLDRCLIEQGFPHGALTLRVHLQLADRLRAGGFMLRWVERDWIHPVWWVRMCAGFAADADSIKGVRKQVRRALRDIGLWVASDEVSVSFSGKVIKVSFVHQAGLPGRVSFSSKGLAVKPGATRNTRAGVQ